jgi:hypothetical protein
LLPETRMPSSTVNERGPRKARAFSGCEWNEMAKAASVSQLSHAGFSES